MFGRASRHAEIAALQRQAGVNAREKERARLDLQASFRRLARFLEEFPLDDGLASIADGLQGKRDDG